MILELLHALKNYDKRVDMLASCCLLNKVTNDRQKFKEFDNVEFLNIQFQTLCFLLENSIKRKKCLKADIELFIESLDEHIYKKNLTLEQIKELAAYLIRGLTNNGKAFVFPYPVIEVGETHYKQVQLIETDTVVEHGVDKLSYSLTMQGYHFMLATKEYDELLQIQVSQMLAKIRLSRDDYEGALNDVRDILNNLEIQRQKIDSFIKKIRSNINEIKNQSYTKIVDETYQILEEEMNRYDELKKEAIMKQQDKEKYLSSKKNLSPEKEATIHEKLIQLHEFIMGVNSAKDSASRLLTRVQRFHNEHKSILEQFLKIPVLKKFSFKKEIQERLESDVNNLDGVQRILATLFDCRVGNIFEVNVPYKEQKILDKRDNEQKRFVIDDDDLVSVEDKEKKERIRKYEEQYLYIFKQILRFGKENNRFTLKELVKHLLEHDKNSYIEMTKDAHIFRNILLYFATLQNPITNEGICAVLERGSTSPDTEFQVERVFEQIKFNESELLSDFEQLESNQIAEDVFSLKTEVDLLEFTATPMEVTNIEFKFLFNERGWI